MVFNFPREDKCGIIKYKTCRKRGRETFSNNVQLITNLIFLIIFKFITCQALFCLEENVYSLETLTFCSITMYIFSR